MLANEGYTVMEIGYNLPEQDNIFTSTSPMKLEYFENAIRQLLAHPKSYGDRVCVIGQCKGGDIAHALVRVRTFYRKLFISKMFNVEKIKISKITDQNFSSGFFWIM